jgi:transcriptional/translational regulatory protein YebC/TACO1
VRQALQSAGIDYDSAESEFVAGLNIDVDLDTARKLFRIIDALEDSDDVQNVFGNFDVTDEIVEQLAEED